LARSANYNSVYRPNSSRNTCFFGLA
jgi:hypothetical protein